MLALAAVGCSSSSSFDPASVADAAGGNLDQNFAGLGLAEFHIGDTEFLALFLNYCSFDKHD